MCVGWWTNDKFFFVCFIFWQLIIGNRSWRFYEFLLIITHCTNTHTQNYRDRYYSSVMIRFVCVILHPITTLIHKIKHIVKHIFIQFLKNIIIIYWNIFFLFVLFLFHKHITHIIDFCIFFRKRSLKRNKKCVENKNCFRTPLDYVIPFCLQYTTFNVMFGCSFYCGGQLICSLINKNSNFSNDTTHKHTLIYI